MANTSTDYTFQTGTDWFETLHKRVKIAKDLQSKTLDPQFAHYAGLRRIKFSPTNERVVKEQTVLEVDFGD